MYALSQGHGQGTPALVSEETCFSCCLGDFGTGMLVLAVCPVFYFVHSEGCPMQNSRHLWLAGIADASHKKRFHGMILEFCNSTQVFYITGVELKMVRIAP